MMIPYVRGRVTKQAHVGIPEGLIEEEVGRDGFFGHYAHHYRTEAPVGWLDIQGPLKPRAFRFNETKGSADYIAARREYFYNQDVKVLTACAEGSMEYFFRNADGDEVLFIHDGSGEIETDYGPLEYTEGDYLVIPRGTVYRMHAQSLTKLLIIESATEIRFPDKGMLGHTALFDPAVLRVPTPETKSRGEAGKKYELRIKRCNEITKVIYPFYPINTVGWKGTMAVYQLNYRDIRPVTSDRYHLPPSVHTTFVANKFVICSFLPRPLENGDPTAIKVPFYHSNIDFDEILFYHSGDFFSRKGIEQGMFTLHPQGIHHGPQPGADERSKKMTRTDEVAVMIDTRNPLKISSQCDAQEWKEYWKSWQKK